MSGADLSGNSGMTGKVNNHEGKLIGGALLSTAFAALTGVAMNNPANLASNAVASNMSSIGSQLTQANLNIPPTIEVPPGGLFNVMVERDLILSPYTSNQSLQGD
jgi:type IV secretion system protein VirB10